MKGYIFCALIGALAGALFGMHDSGLVTAFLAGEQLYPEDLHALIEPAATGTTGFSCVWLFVRQVI